MRKVSALNEIAKHSSLMDVRAATLFGNLYIIFGGLGGGITDLDKHSAAAGRNFALAMREIFFDTRRRFRRS